MRRGIRVILSTFSTAPRSSPAATDRAREQTKAGLEETAWAASLRSVGWDFGPALWANSEYARHYHGATRALLCYCVKFYHRLRPYHGN